MTPHEWLQLLLFQCSVSLLAVGGAVTLAPDLHRSLVAGHGWLSDAQFNSALTLAQVAPGPNVLFIALVGWNVGLNAAAGDGAAMRLLLGALGVAVCVGGVLGPSSLLMLAAARWGRRHRERLAVRAFRQGMAPIVVGVLLSTSWLLVRSAGDGATSIPFAVLVAVTTLLVWRTRLHLLWLLGAGAVLGALGVV